MFTECFLGRDWKNEVRKIIAKSPTKSCSLNPAPTWMVKDSVDELIPMVTILVNLSLQSANVPDSMKQALVTPLLKKDDIDPEVLKNYRPVSNLSFLSKVLERVVAARLTNYINQLHEPTQSAYRACHSTETALVRVRTTSFALSIRVGLRSLCYSILALLSIQSITPSFYLGWSQFLELKDLLYSGSNRTCYAGNRGLKSMMTSPKIRKSCGLYHRDLCWVHYCS